MSRIGIRYFHITLGRIDFGSLLCGADAVLRNSSFGLQLKHRRENSPSEISNCNSEVTPRGRVRAGSTIKAGRQFIQCAAQRGCESPVDIPDESLTRSGTVIPEPVRRAA